MNTIVLTPTEYLTMELLSKGLSVTEIAAKTNRQRSSVARVLCYIKNKANTKDSYKLLAMFMRQNNRFQVSNQTRSFYVHNR